MVLALALAAHGGLAAVVIVDENNERVNGWNEGTDLNPIPHAPSVEWAPESTPTSKLAEHANDAAEDGDDESPHALDTDLTQDPDAPGTGRIGVLGVYHADLSVPERYRPKLPDFNSLTDQQKADIFGPYKNDEVAMVWGFACMGYSILTGGLLIGIWHYDRKKKLLQ